MLLSRQLYHVTKSYRAFTSRFSILHKMSCSILITHLASSLTYSLIIAAQSLEQPPTGMALKRDANEAALDSDNRPSSASPPPSSPAPGHTVSPALKMGSPPAPDQMDCEGHVDRSKQSGERPLHKRDIKDSLEHCLSSVRYVGHFAAFQASQKTVDPGLRVESVGDIRLPLAVQDAEAIMKVGRCTSPAFSLPEASL